MKIKTALITGGLGFIGSHIAEALTDKGVYVIILDNMKTGRMENTIPWFNREKGEIIPADISEYSAIRQHFAGVDVVFHNAASKCTVCTEDPKRDLMVNALGTLNVITAAHESGVKKVIHASTGSVNHINSFYGNSKNAGEHYLGVFKNYHPDFNYTALRYHHVYGPRQDCSDKGGVIPIFIRKIYCGEPVTIFGDGLQVRHFTHVSDIVRANLWAAENSVSDCKAYNVLSNVSITINQLVEALGYSMKREVKVLYDRERRGDIRSFNVNNGEIGWDGFTEWMTLEDGLRETIAWYCRKFEKREAA